MSVGAEQIALEVLKVVIATGGGIVELVTEKDRAELEERIRRAELAIKDPIDTTADDAARRQRLEAILGGGDPGTRPTEPPTPIPAADPARARVLREVARAVEAQRLGNADPTPPDVIRALRGEAPEPPPNPYPDAGSE